MGRRKIEIKAIKDDRNRSVTFLKRKGGLFKKAHELSVLCQVDVAVIIFGHNKKLYEFSSGNIQDTIQRYQYYGSAHEHKGPEDFMGKKDVDDEDEDEEHISQSRESQTPPEHAMMPHHLQQQQQFQHMRQVTPSASPPMPNMGFHRHASPQPGTMSRPDSRAQIRRTSSNLAPPPHQFSQPPPPQNNYAYMGPNTAFYSQPPPQMVPQQPLGPPHGMPHAPQQPPQFQYSQPPPANPQMQFMKQEQRGGSMPPAFQQQPERSQSQPQPQPHHSMHMPSPPLPQHHQQHQQQQQQQQQQQNHQQQQQQQQNHQQQQSHQQQNHQQQNHFQSPPLPQPKPLSDSKKHSIFTPIEESRSMFQGFLGGGNNMDPLRYEPPHIKSEGARSQSIDVAVMSRPNVNGNAAPRASPAPAPVPVSVPQRTQSTSSVPIIHPPSRTNSLQSDVKKPRLQLQIPSEHSDAGSATAGSSPKDSTTTGATPAQTSTGASGNSVLLPPPSPSTNSLLSAGATGPPNPFARPPPPSNSNSYGSRNDMETPLSALPSRFVDNLLPSPSGFLGDWAYSRDGNMLPSPLPFGTTPVASSGPSFRDDDPPDRKRKTSEEGSDGGGGPKRIKA